MDGGLLVSAQLSSLFPSSQVTSVVVQTVRQNTPLPPPLNESGPLAEHASFSSTLHTPTTGTILLRVLHGGLILELVSLSTEHAPIRFVFPAAILPSPAIFLWRSDELHIIAVTTTGSLYRLVLPIGRDRQLWQDQVSGNWCREYLIKCVVGSVQGLVQVQGTHSVAIGLSDGSLLRLETENLGDDTHHDEWTESFFQHGSFLHQLTSFLPTLATPSSNASEIISMTSHPWPTDISHVWTLSRDRTLRFWKAKIGCVCSKTLSLKIPGRATPPSPSSAVNDSKPRVLLEAGQQTLLRAFVTPSSEEHVYVLAFNPTPSSSTSGGIFQLIDTFSNQLREIRTIECSKSSAHCRLQDFAVANNTLYVLWDRQGQSAVEKTALDPEELNGDFEAATWKIASYAPESELTPAYLEELLLAPGSLTERYCEAVMRPGMFSTLTLRTAIDQYTDTCLSLPGPPPPQLTTVYGNLAENIIAVVGCTVNLIRDQHTGALQYTKFWNALKRDWEGFIARCREIERSARWPLAIGVEEPNGDIIIIERERVGALVGEDLALKLHRHLVSGIQVDPQNPILDISWMLRDRLGARWMLNMENGLVDILHQEIAFSFADILQDQARRSNFREDLDEGLENWILGRLHGIPNVDQSIRSALDIMGGFDLEIKREETEDGLLAPPPQPEWWKSMISTYVMITVEARHELCLALFTLLFFLADDLAMWDPSLLAEIFAVYRGIAMLRFVSRQPAGDSSGHNLQGDVITPDDVASSMRNMHVSSNRTHFMPTHSLVHRLLAPLGETRSLPVAAHRFLDNTGLLQSSSPAYATKSEVLFCDRLRLLGYSDVAREMLAWLPRTSGVIYVLARLWLALGRADDASYLMEKLAASFGPHNALSLEDMDALATVLPSAELCDSEFSFYLHAAALFKSAMAVHHEVDFSQLALSVAPEGVDTTTLWHSIIRGHTDLGLYDDAYASLISTPYDQQRRECVSYLVYRMCEDNAVEKLMTFNFAGFADDVEDALSFKARNVDPRVRPFYSRILYSWYVFRGDYRNAALTMYQRAQKLHDIVSDPSLIVSLVEEQLEAYLVAMNSLSLLDQKNAWVVMPVFGESGRESHKRRKLSGFIPEDKYINGKQDAEILYLEDIQYQYALLVAQLALIRKDPNMLSSPDPLLPPSLVVLKLAQSNRFNLAIATARSLKVDMTDLFAHLTRQCLRLSRNPDADIPDESADWLLTDNVSSWPGTPAEKGWRYLRQSLERHDKSEPDYKYTKVALETILSFEQSSLVPSWLLNSLEANHPEYLIRTFLRYEDFQSALEQTLSLIRKVESQVARGPPKTAGSTWLPYTLVDQVLAATTAQAGLSPHTEKLRQELQAELANWVKRMHKLSQFSR